jgi:23S rRNA (adenine2503-C2)-methyltransferase
MHVSDLRLRLRALGALPVHEERVLRRWSRAQPQEGGRKRLDSFLPKPLLLALPGLVAEWDGLARVASSHPAGDGSARLLVALADGQSVETVLLPAERAQAVCISSQVGCAVGCLFCMTGQGGLLRQLGSAEIVAQVVLARQQLGPAREVRKVVFMGMGEPAHNLDAVMDAIQLLGTAGGIGHKQLVLSTVGDPRVFERLSRLGPADVKPALALSLHTSKGELRQRLLPRAPGFEPQDLVDAGERYARASGYPVQYQWALMAGVNDGDDEVEGIARLLAGKYALMNLIPYNAVAELPYRRPAAEHAADMARALHRRGVLTKLRQSAGQDVDAGCGQLRARQLPLQWQERSPDLEPVQWVGRPLR